MSHPGTSADRRLDPARWRGIVGSAFPKTADGSGLDVDRARRNWAEAQAYRAELLDKRLVLFWSNFRQSAMLQRAGNAA
jgi:hypothetical protein